MAEAVDTVRQPSVFDVAGPLAQALGEIGWALIAAATAIFLIVIVVLVRALRTAPVPAEQQRRLALRWILGGGIAFPVVVLSLWLVLATMRTAAFVDDGRRIAVDPRTLVVAIDGRMWWWRIRYVGGSGSDGNDDARGAVDVVTANELRLPAGRPIRLALTSDDVIHSFWVPALGGKVDMVPGRLHHLELDGLVPGRYRGQCAEYCGEQHARMALHVVIEPAERFDQWLAAQRATAVVAAGNEEPASSDTGSEVGSKDETSRGLEVFREARCDGCHAVRGLTGDVDAGPDLTHVGSRLFIGAGTLANDRPSLERWLTDLQRLKAGVRMPAYDRLADADRIALAHFLASLK